ncbi:hypothetical protein [Halopseudomonas nanhaiensis]|uniref:hypothetical protein n=1 Tax=Halopseudomonas nanhaiensis TaxID=2830842 RepID=UPI001CBBB694|nr:hypothetical protein [Halopseudomonas nanhaiensis]
MLLPAPAPLPAVLEPVPGLDALEALFVSVICAAEPAAAASLDAAVLAGPLPGFAAASLPAADPVSALEPLVVSPGGWTPTGVPPDAGSEPPRSATGSLPALVPA